MKILVVHHERTIADFIANFLDCYSHRALPLYDAGETLDHLWEIRFDVALISIVMPAVTGEDLGDRYLTDAFQAGCKVILFACEDVVKAMKAQRPDFKYLAIPFEHEHLLSILRETERELESLWPH